MSVDTATSIGAFDLTIPSNSDAFNEGDDNFVHIKTVLKTDFPAILGVVTASHTELSYCDGVTSAIQTQLDAKGAIAGQTWTGTHGFTGATITVPTQSAGDTTTLAASTAFVANAVATQTAVGFSATTTATSKTIVAFEHVMVTASGQTITLPASPTAGTTVCRISTRASISTTVGRNALNIMGAAADMTIPYGNCTVTLAYHNVTDGWVLQ